ncbi:MULTISPECIES: type II toxin-antitoxin system SpoIISA family toxin [Bacillus]|uniref:Two-component apoptosis factor n=1 Tax=Bacillus amyloliquefaciens (strain ATCC 23350 / DSM 7 / BCRC 11601 / CCUG 28519 / NBRC 15535 / NRRL B-14393 / F) TaxID=692420 RepID=A0A9P1JGG3_BACAS|nr:type II toxin-antitoxin system SpoIISA family toxin [Bacillus amyloliquefaciens]AIW33322.1 stage II sporulation protein SA [Bacillus subtilis]AEB24309.1 two-component apoptosis factor [Bacillus amyloliquefaciens TA208]AEB62925.1 two-component apoptosis factor [Bacillus amyloliquefaciens LL3]AEK89322.1 stage II sporulation protein SA (Killer protein) [Bacillus amyloliquefaciens XH7]ARW38569.1 Stage II sporulation protein SA [Bacillus amyloliquefaciens]
MLLFYQIMVWTMAAALILYVYASWRYEAKVKEKMFAIRKTWYLLFVVGAMVYWTYDPESLFAAWRQYLIVAVCFALIDAFIFLSAYIKKLAGNELETDTREILEENNEMLHSYLEKLKTYQYLLKNEPIHVYYGSTEAYAEGISRLLAAYAEKMNVTASLCDYSAQSDKDRLTEHMPDAADVQSRLNRKDVYYDQKGRLVLIPFTVQNRQYVIKLTSENLLTEFDYLLFTSLTSIYDLMLPIEEEGDG